MKKMMVVGVALLMSFGIKAAQFSWMAAQVYDSTGTSFVTGDVKIYAYLSTETMADSFCVGTATPNSNGAILTSTTSTPYVNIATGAENELVFELGSTYKFYLEILDNGYTFSTAGIEELGRSALIEKDKDFSISFGNIKAYTTEASNWKAVPEPTSGLLLLLGMAGLALRRKRV